MQATVMRRLRNKRKHSAVGGNSSFEIPVENSTKLWKGNIDVHAILRGQDDVMDMHANASGPCPMTGFSISCIQTSRFAAC